MSTRRICDAADVALGEARAFEVQGDALIVVHTPRGLHVYENRCPHQGTSLDWAPGRFLSVDGRHLQCATHGALFRLDDGHCVSGPCAGRDLARRHTQVKGGVLELVESLARQK